jgi:hypothetical protein
VNQSRLRLATELVAELQRAGIEVLVLKGLALSLLFYGDLSVRPMGDVDLLVRSEQARDAVHHLEQAGYRSTELLPDDAPRWQREGDDDWYWRDRPEIFVHSESQRAIAEASKKRVAARFTDPIVVPISNARIFFPADESHQDYYIKHPAQYRFYRWSCGRDARLQEIWGT